MYKTIAELSAALKAKDVSSVELTQSYLDRINTLNPTLNAFVTVCAEQALAQAKAADAIIAAGNAGPLTGVPMAQKDIFCTEGVKTTCSSKMLDNFVPPYSATVVEKINAAGMPMLGKTSMDEFAMGSSNETAYHGVVRNPWDTNKVPGGSSGGSASAVSAGLSPVATGTDTGGSIRQPASLCGITGLKPTYGRVSRWGMIAFASSLDQAGVLSRSAEDAALMLEAMAGFDHLDSTSMQRDVPNYSASLNDSIEGLTIGLPKEFFSEGLDAGTEQAVREAVKTYESLGAKVKEISLPNMALSVPCYYVIAPAEASSNLSRFDGVKFGHRCDNPQDLEDLYKRTRAEGFGEEVKRRILIGTYVLSHGYYDAYYLQAQKLRRMIRDDFLKAFAEVDLIAGPVTTGTAFGVGEKLDDPLAMYLSDIYTIAVNLAGLPGMSIPAGEVNGLPVGLQLIGQHFGEARLLNAAHQFQVATDFHTHTPDLG